MQSAGHRRLVASAVKLRGCPIKPGHLASGCFGRSVRQSQLLAGLKLGLLLLAMSDVTEAVTPIPAGLTELSSSAGQQMLRNSTPTDQFWLLAQEFTTQDSQDWCGLASATMVLNALPIPKPALKAFEGWVSATCSLPCIFVYEIIVYENQKWCTCASWPCWHTTIVVPSLL